MDSVVPPLMFKRWTREEDAVLLSHVREKGTKQWSLLHASGKLPDRDNKACCNRWRILKAKLQLKSEGASAQTDPPTPERPAPVVPSPAKQEPDTCQFSSGSNSSSPYSSQASSFRGPTAHPRILSFPSVLLQNGAQTGSPQSSSSHSGVPTGCLVGAGSAPALLPSLQEDYEVPTAEFGEPATWMLPGIDLLTELPAPFQPDGTLPWSNPGCLVGEALTAPLPSEVITDDDPLANDSIFGSSDKVKPESVDEIRPASSQCLIGRVIDEPLIAELMQTPASLAPSPSPSQSHSQSVLHRNAYLQQHAAYLGNADLSQIPRVRQLASPPDHSTLNPSFNPSAPSPYRLPQRTTEEVPRLLRALPVHNCLGNASETNPPAPNVLPRGMITQIMEPHPLLFHPGRSTMHLPCDPAQTMFSGKSMARSWTTGNLNVTAGRHVAQSADQMSSPGQMVFPSRSGPASPAGQLSAGSFFSESRQARSGHLGSKPAGQRRISLKSLCPKSEHFSSESEHQQAIKRARHIEGNNMLLWRSPVVSTGPNIGPSNGQEHVPQLDMGGPFFGQLPSLSSNSWAEMRKRWMAKQMNPYIAQEKRLDNHGQLIEDRAAQSFTGEAPRSGQTLASQLQELENRESGLCQPINVPCGGADLPFPGHYAPSGVEGTGLKRNFAFLC